jgi:hypothetical protein
MICSISRGLRHSIRASGPVGFNQHRGDRLPHMTESVWAPLQSRLRKMTDRLRSKHGELPSEKPRALSAGNSGRWKPLHRVVRGSEPQPLDHAAQRVAWYRQQDRPALHCTRATRHGTSGDKPSGQGSGLSRRGLAVLRRLRGGGVIGRRIMPCATANHVVGNHESIRFHFERKHVRGVRCR